jgi:hypothetical protein
MISPELQIALARERVDDLRRAADARRLTHRRAQPASPEATDRSVTLRFASWLITRPHAAVGWCRATNQQAFLKLAAPAPPAATAKTLACVGQRNEEKRHGDA